MINKKPNYKIVYYTGTGGSEMVANHFDETLRMSGCLGDMDKITTGYHHNNSSHDLLILIFPVHAFNAPEAVYHWIKHTETVNKIPAVVVSVSGGGEVSPNTASRRSSIRKLEKKGYEVIYEKMIVMPSNWVVATNELLSIMLLDILPDKVKNIVNDLLTGEKIRTSPLFFDRIMSVLGEMEKPAARFWGKHIKVSDDCNGCGLCSKNCPAGNISMIASTPIFGKKCHLCLKCIYGCPQRALTPGFGKFVIIKDGYDLKEIVKKSPISQSVQIDNIAKGSLWKGVRKYLSEKC